MKFIKRVVMIQSINGPLSGKQINKLPKIYEHYKEFSKISFIKQAILSKQINPSLTAVDYIESLFDGGVWTLKHTQTSVNLIDYISAFMSTVYFKNKPVNENVYFYRFLNVVKSLISSTEFEQLLFESINHGEIFHINIQEYIKYRNKINEMTK
jgi:hypothetical protein